jgi:hypothetical protein
VVAEVLQGYADDAQAERVSQALARFLWYDVGGRDLALQSTPIPASSPSSATWA